MSRSRLAAMSLSLPDGLNLASFSALSSGPVPLGAYNVSPFCHRAFTCRQIDSRKKNENTKYTIYYQLTTSEAKAVSYN